MEDLLKQQVEEIYRSVESQSCGECNLTKLPCVKSQPECFDCDIAHKFGWFVEK